MISFHDISEQPEAKDGVFLQYLSGFLQFVGADAWD